MFQRGKQIGGAGILLAAFDGQFILTGTFRQPLYLRVKFLRVTGLAARRRHHGLPRDAAATSPPAAPQRGFAEIDADVFRAAAGARDPAGEDAF